MTFAAHLDSLVFGQDAAIAAVEPALLGWRHNLSQPRRPAGSFLFLGPTGTGKTHFVESVAAMLHDRPLGQNVLRIDCAEYQHGHEVAKLIGAPPGYLGHGNGGTDALLNPRKVASMRTQSCALAVILFDEIEKAHNAVYRLLLGVLDKAEMSTGNNETVYFEDSLIFMTSNLGAREIGATLSQRRIGLPGATSRSRQAHAIAVNAARRHFSPEFMNRLTDVVTFDPLRREALARILGGYIDDYNALVKARHKGYRLLVEDDAFDWLLERGTSAEYGARELRRTLERHVLTPILRDMQEDCSIVEARLDGDGIAIEWSARAKARTA